MLDVLAGWGDDLARPLALGVLGVALTWLPGRGQRRAVMVIGASALAFLVAVRALPGALDAVVDGPPWFSGVALAAGVVTAAAMVRLLATGRGPEGVLLLGVGLGAAAAALPDVEALIGATALWVPWGLARQSPPGPGRGDDERWEWTDASVAAAVAAVVLVALVDGARGRPGALLIAPMVVGPVVLAALLPAPRSRVLLAARAGVAGVIGLLVARHAALGAATVRPLVGAVAGLVALTLLWTAVAARWTTSEARRAGRLPWRRR